MPRKLELTFQQGSGTRAGRWKKHYRGKTHYLGSGRSKSDAESYKAALANWNKLRPELDAEAIEEPKPFQNEYEEVIGEWELVLSWSVEHDDEANAIAAREALRDLRARFDRPKPPPVTHDDRLWSRYRLDRTTLQEISDRAVATATPESLREMERVLLARDPAKRPVPAEMSGDAIDQPNSVQVAEIQWQDRLASQASRQPVDDEQTLGEWVKVYLTRQQQRVEAGDLNAGRYITIQSVLHHFRDWAGAKTTAASITGQTLTRFHSAQLDLISSKQCAPGYAKGRMGVVKSFIRWLWEQDVLEHLPKNVNSRALKTSQQVKSPETCPIADVQTILKRSTGRTRLYVLLALNCGMTQQDIADLKQEQVDWKAGIVTRKRSKTASYEGVPTVSYKLWPETLQLLREHRSDTPLVLINEKGAPLVVQRLTPTGRLQKNDNVKNAYERVLKKAKLKRPFKLLRKTSATLINADDRYRGLDPLFLGHAPATVAARHYTATSQTALDSALAFLRTKYNIASLSAGESDGVA